MKKFFTLIAAVCATLTVNAQTDGVFKLEGINCGLPEDGQVEAWGWYQQATNDSESHQDETTGEWIVDKEATYDYKDASAYDYIVVQFEANEVGAHFICVDNTWAKQIPTDFVAGATYVAVDLATSEVGTFKDNIACFVMQPFAAGTLKVKEVDYMTADAYQKFVEESSKTVIEKDLALPGVNGVVTMSGEDEGNSGWHDAGWIGQGDLASLYKTFVVEFTAEHPFRLCAQNMVKGEDGNWTATDQVAKFIEGSADKKIVAYTIGDEGELQGLGQYAVTNEYVVEYGEAYMDPDTGEMVDGNTYGDNTVTILRAYLTNQVVESTYTPGSDPAGITEVKADNVQTGVMYNVAGQRVNSAKGLVIMNGKKMIAE